MAKGKIEIKWDVSESSGTEYASFEDLCVTEAEWDALSNEEKNDKLQDYLDELPERVSIILDEYKVK
jgi:hypothetical protein